MFRPWSLLLSITLPSSGHSLAASSFLRPQTEGFGARQDVFLQQGSEFDVQRLSVLKPDANTSRPVLSVHLMNGLGNQLFQVSALLALALESNSKFSVALPNVKHVCCNRTTYWHTVLRKLGPFLQDGLQPENSRFAGVHQGRVQSSMKSQGRVQSSMKSLGGTCQLEQLSGFDPVDKDCRKATVFNTTWASQLKSLSNCRTVMLSGYFQNKKFFSRHLSFLQQLFWDDVSVKRARKRLADLVPGHGKPVVSIHYRLGDYEPNGWVLSDDYYNQGLSKVGHRLETRPFCLVFSDDAPRAWMHSSSLDGCDGLALVPSEVDDVTSFYMMGLTEASILADSTFAYWAALLGQRWKQIVIAPKLADQRAECWSYLDARAQDSRIDSNTKPEWLMVPATRVSPEALFLEEVFTFGQSQ